MGKPNLSKETRELLNDLVGEAFGKVRQIRAEKKKLADREKVIFKKLIDHGITKQMFMEAFRRAGQDLTQLNLFDQGAMICEDRMREILSENVTEKEHDQAPEAEPDPAGEDAKPKKGRGAAKKAAKKTAEKPGGSKTGQKSSNGKEPKPADKERKAAADNVVPIGPKPHGRVSHRQQVQQPAQPPRLNPNSFEAGQAMERIGAKPGADGVSLADLPPVSGTGLGGTPGFVDRSERMSTDDYNALMRQGSDHS